MRILIIEDEPALSQLLKENLQDACYAVDVENDGERGSYRARTNDYDLILLDDILPGKRGSEICRELREGGKTMPILLVSGQYSIERKVSLLNDGADDYITKPFSLEEVNARVRALLRRPRAMTSDELRVGNLTLDRERYAAVFGDTSVPLTAKEFALLQYLMVNAGKVVSRTMILEHVWDGNADSFSNAMETHVANLRRKFMAIGMSETIRTVAGRGYMIEESKKLEGKRQK